MLHLFRDPERRVDIEWAAEKGVLAVERREHFDDEDLGWV